MKRTNRLILLIGVLLAAVAFVGIIVVFNNQSGGGQKPVETANVVVAARDIKLGDAITSDMVGTKQIPLAEKKPDEFSNPGEVAGQVARTDIAKDAFLTQSMFAGTGAPSIAKDLPAGMLAIAVKVDAITGVGTLILPGDRVDVVITIPIQLTLVNQGADPSAPPAFVEPPSLKDLSSKLILQNVEVRAVLGASAGTAPASAGGTTAQAPTDLSTVEQVVILGVTPQQAEVIENLQQRAAIKSPDGALLNITLVLRSPKDKDAPDVKTTGIILKTLITDYGVLPPAILEASLPPTK